jgi:hypothetical protein
VFSEVGIVLDIQGGRRQIGTRQHAAIHVSFTGRGRPRRVARACSSPQVTRGDRVFIGVDELNKIGTPDSVEDHTIHR